ncbi:hypothetical protein JOB18_042401 [Solea senegalensis]|uniref:Uncharacterized protein n=1 Tax=Solea senegalensis TaxID=28829 RepID=A0AAV6SJF6_SOLSE|nr:hypothetical protein JOB18_042401 [Solea senegalensis]
MEYVLQMSPMAAVEGLHLLDDDAGTSRCRKTLVTTSLTYDLYLLILFCTSAAAVGSSQTGPGLTPDQMTLRTALWPENKRPF